MDCELYDKIMDYHIKYGVPIADATKVVMLEAAEQEGLCQYYQLRYFPGNGQEPVVIANYLHRVHAENFIRNQLCDPLSYSVRKVEVPRAVFREMFPGVH